MTISIGSIGTGLVSSGSETQTCTTTAINTTGATGFVVIAIMRPTVNTNYTISLTNDSAGNSYTQIGSQINDGNSPAENLARFYCQNGTGAASHTVTCGIPASDLGLWIVWLIPIFGNATTGMLDQSNTSSSFTSQPWTAGSIAITPPSGNELLISVNINFEYPGSASYTTTNLGAAATWTVQAFYGNGNFGNPPEGALATAIVTSNGTYQVGFDTT